MSIPLVDLSPSDNGLQMPQLGLGTWKAEPGIVGKVVQEAIKLGYRSIDCACDYGNEDEVGKGIEEGLSAAGIGRSDIFITSKLWNTYHRPEHVRPALQKTLLDLNTPYLDLYLIHFPICLKYVPIEKRYPPGWVPDPDDPAQQQMVLEKVPIRDTWEALEALVDEGLVRHIGLSNFPASLILELLKTARIRPSVLQVELHPYLQQTTLLEFCKRERIAVTAFSPLGAASYVPLGLDHGDNLLEEPLVADIAKNHGKSAAQVMIRWAVQRGTSVIPKTSRVERLTENMDAFSWSLSTEDMGTIASLNRGRRYNDPAIFGAQFFGLSVPIYD